MSFYAVFQRLLKYLVYGLHTFINKYLSFYVHLFNQQPYELQLPPLYPSTQKNWKSCKKQEIADLNDLYERM